MNWENFLSQFLNVCIDIAWKLVASAIVFFAGRFLIKLLIKHVPNGKRYAHLDPTARTFISSFLKITLYATLIISIVAIMGVPMASVVTVFASAGAAIALAVQGSFSNLMAGVMLLIFKPIGVGEFIKVGDVSGNVCEVGIFYTKLKTTDNLTITIPNSTLTGSTITNYSREELRRVDITLDVSYDSDVEEVKKTILSVIDKNDKALKTPEPYARLSAMKDSSLEFTVRAWCKSENYFALKSDLLEQCGDEFNKAGIVIPYNQLDIHIKDKG